MGQDQTRIIYITFVMLEFQILRNKFQGNPPTVLQKKIALAFITIYGHNDHHGHLTIISFPHPT